MVFFMIEQINIQPDQEEFIDLQSELEVVDFNETGMLAAQSLEIEEAEEIEFNFKTLDEIKEKFNLVESEELVKIAASTGGDVLKKDDGQKENRQWVYKDEEGKEFPITADEEILSGLYDSGYFIKEVKNITQGLEQTEIHIYFADDKGRVSYEIFKKEEKPDFEIAYPVVVMPELETVTAQTDSLAEAKFDELNEDNLVINLDLNLDNFFAEEEEEEVTGQPDQFEITKPTAILKLNGFKETATDEIFVTKLIEPKEDIEIKTVRIEQSPIETIGLPKVIDQKNNQNFIEPILPKSADEALRPEILEEPAIEFFESEVLPDTLTTPTAVLVENRFSVKPLNNNFDVKDFKNLFKLPTKTVLPASASLLLTPTPYGAPITFEKPINIKAAEDILPDFKETFVETKDNSYVGIEEQEITKPANPFIKKDYKNQVLTKTAKQPKNYIKGQVVQVVKEEAHNKLVEAPMQEALKEIDIQKDAEFNALEQKVVNIKQQFTKDLPLVSTQKKEIGIKQMALKEPAKSELKPRAIEYKNMDIKINNIPFKINSLEKQVKTYAILNSFTKYPAASRQEVKLGTTKLDKNNYADREVNKEIIKQPVKILPNTRPIIPAVVEKKEIDVVKAKAQQELLKEVMVFEYKTASTVPTAKVLDPKLTVAIKELPAERPIKLKSILPLKKLESKINYIEQIIPKIKTAQIVNIVKEPEVRRKPQLLNADFKKYQQIQVLKKSESPTIKPIKIWSNDIALGKLKVAGSEKPSINNASQQSDQQNQQVTDALNLLAKAA